MQKWFSKLKGWNKPYRGCFCCTRTCLKVLAFKWSHLDFELNTPLRGSGSSHLCLWCLSLLLKLTEKKGRREKEEEEKEKLSQRKARLLMGKVKVLFMPVVLVQLLTASAFTPQSVLIWTLCECGHTCRV